MIRRNHRIGIHGFPGILPVAIRLATVVVASALISATAGAGLFDFNADCNDPDEQSARIVELKSLYTKLIEPIEGVPPAEAEYIRKEREESLRPPGNPPRFRLVYAHRFYQAVQVHDSFDTVMGHLEAAESAASLPDKIGALVDALEAAGTLAERVSDYIDADSARTDPILTADATGSLSFRMSSARGFTALTAKCFLRAIAR